MFSGSSVHWYNFNQILSGWECPFSKHLLGLFVQKGISIMQTFTCFISALLATGTYFIFILNIPPWSSPCQPNNGILQWMSLLGDDKGRKNPCLKGKRHEIFVSGLKLCWTIFVTEESWLPGIFTTGESLPGVLITWRCLQSLGNLPGAIITGP
jgi:hypothetical protein